MWNNTKEDVSVFIRVGNKIIYDNKMASFPEEKNAQTFHQLDLKLGEEILASAEKENAIRYNIVL